MGWAKDHIPGGCERIARELIPDWQPPGKRPCRCPFPGHPDQHPSFQYDLEEDSYRCFSHPNEAEAQGDLVDLWARLTGVSDPKEGLKRFIARYAPDQAGQGKKPGQGAKKGPKPADQGKAKQSAKVVPQEELDALPPLTEAWLKRLESKRGWSRELIQALDLRLWTPPKWLKDQGQRVAIPIRDEAGRLVNIRLYRPGGAAQNKVLSYWTGAKETKVSYGEPPRLWPYAPPAGIAGPLWLCEGEPDCLCALSHGLNAITATGGAGTWRDEWAARFQGQEVIIAYDADHKGRHGAHKAVKALLGAAASVRVISWPDFMLADGELPDNHGQDLTDWFVTHGRDRAELERLAQAAPLVEPPEPGTDLAALRDAGDAMVQCKAWTEFDLKTAYRAMLLVRDLLSEYRIVVEAETGLIYIWEGRYWLRAVKDEIKRLIALKMGLIATRARIEEAWELLRNHVTMPRGEKMDLRPELLCLANGMLDLNTGRLLAHDPPHRCTYLFPYEWRPHDPPDCRWFKRTLREMLADPEVIGEVLDFMGYCLWPGQHYKKALLMVGPKDCGKSLLQEVIRQLLGPDNCSAVNMADLEDQFQRVALHRKKANICGETSANFFASENFKRLTGGDPIQAAYKGVDSFTFDTPAKLIFAANEFPKVRDQSEAFYERMLAVNFPRQFKLGGPWVDPHRLERIIPQELPGIFHLAVARLYHLRRRGAFSQCQASYLYLNQYRLENDHISRFVMERCDLQDFDGGIPEGPKAAVYTAYKGWCEDNGLKKPKDSSAFWKAVRQRHPQVEFKEHGPTLGDGSRPPWVVGLYLRELGQQAA
ncbi:MAG: phage/plasmid primase, P4 family [Pseudomonadota bacterium]